MPIFSRKKVKTLTFEKPPKLEARVFCALVSEGVYPCYFCGKVMMLKKLNSLSFSRCQTCGEQNFIPKRLGGYVLYRPLGGGGMGSVYKALAFERPKEFFAIKLLAREQRENKHLIDKVLEEANIVKSIKGSKNCLEYVEHGFSENEFFFAMHYVKGLRIDQILSNEEYIEQVPALRIVIELTVADQHIYNHGYLFRDIKPENVIITPGNNAVLIDFGLAIPVDIAKNNPPEMVEGSPHYIPPERLVGLGESAASEIYSLGMFFFHILAGKTFFDAKDKNALAELHVTSDRTETVESRIPNVDPRICHVIEKMIAKKPVDRIQTFNELSLQLFKVYYDITGRKYIV